MQSADSTGSSGVTSIVLIGFSGSGKTTTGRLLADRLGWTLLDLDEAIERHYGMDIPSVFKNVGEADFRQTERRLLIEALRQSRSIIATGGGAVAEDAVWTEDLLGADHVFVVALDADPNTVFDRLTAQQAEEGVRTARPMLEGDNSLQRMLDLKAARQQSYDRADITLITDRAEPDLIAEEIARLGVGSPQFDVMLNLGATGSHIRVGTGIFDMVAPAIGQRFPQARRLWLVSDEHVMAHHGQRLESQLLANGFDVRSIAVAPGEGSKRLATVGVLFDWMLDGGVERNDVVVALGGGVVGDLAGFVAATVLRGIGLVQIPTSLLAMVDSSVGGKTGINHAAGKNLIGAFYQPPLVLIDPQLLRTLPSRELTSGWAEIIKHAVIQRSTPGGERDDLWTFLDRNAERLLSLGEQATTYLIARNVALKGSVVEADEREADLRQILNFGHTLGHAIEAAGYRYVHGEAIAVGMRAAVRIGVLANTCDHSLVVRLDETLNRFGLPSTVDADINEIMALTRSDKKRGAGKQRWVLPHSGGGVVIRDDISERDARTALAQVTQASTPH